MAESSPTFESFIQSGLFTFYIGPERQQFVAHSGAIAATSEHFNALVNGDMVEAKTRVVEYPDVKPEDFVRFLEYAYRHDYTVPPHTQDAEIRPPTPEPSAPEPPAPPKSEEEPAVPAPTPPTIADELTPQIVEVPSAPAEETWGTSYFSGKKKKKVKSRTLRSRFDQLRYSTGDPTAGMLKGFEPRENSLPRQNFTSVFLTHARLYTFADMRLVQPLRNLALYKLHRTLVMFKLYDSRIGDVLELARYAYDHGPDRTASGSIDDLRNLVVQYIACESDTVGKSRDFRYLLEEGGEFVGDFWEIVHKEIL